MDQWVKGQCHRAIKVKSVSAQFPKIFFSKVLKHHRMIGLLKKMTHINFGVTGSMFKVTEPVKIKYVSAQYLKNPLPLNSTG